MYELAEDDFLFEKPKKKTQPPPDLSPIFYSADYSFVSGWLQLRSLKDPGKWTYRYITLTSSQLKFFSHQNSLSPSGIFDFNQLTSTLATVDQQTFLLDFHSCPIQFHFKAESFEERQHWLTAINSQISSSEGSCKILPHVASIPQFWKNQRISDFWFENNASTGDLMFFRSKSLSGSMFRGIHMSQFDHVALLLCYSSGKICVLEATQKNGVGIIEWGEFLNKRLLSVYSRIGFKKLKVERDEVFLLKLTEFIEEVNGKGYRRSMTRARRGNKTWPGTEKFGFSAEILARAYQSLGILNMKCDVDALWPTNFEKDSGLELTSASLGPLLLLDFEL